MQPGSHPNDLSTIGTVRTSQAPAPGTVSVRILHDGVVTARLLPHAGEVVIGRAPDCGVHVPHSSISRRHAVIRFDAGEVEDLGSANGTRVGGRLLGGGERAAMASGVVIQIASVLIVLHWTRADEASSAERPAAVAPSSSETARMVERVAATDLNVLLSGETGVGKNSTAELIHRLSPRARGPFVRLNCSAFTESLLASELFGHEKGAFEGADVPRPGVFETAAGGTVLLDEIGHLPPSLQTRLLRVLEERSVVRIGGQQLRPHDVRLVSSTSRDLPKEVELGRFRADLYFWLEGFSIVIPPLRERREEIGLLAQRIVEESARKLGRPVAPLLTPEALALLESYEWPGNVRELRNAIDRAVLLSDQRILPEHLPREKVARLRAPPVEGTAPPPSSSPSAPLSAEALQEQFLRFERDRLLATLAQCGGNQSQAAKLLGISRNTLATQLERHGVPRPRRRS